MPSTGKKWVPKDQEQDDVKPAAGARVSYKGRGQKGVASTAGAGKSGKGGSVGSELPGGSRWQGSQGQKQPRYAPQTAKPQAAGGKGANQKQWWSETEMSTEEVQQGLSIILQKFKSTPQDESISAGQQQPQPAPELLSKIQPGQKPAKWPKLPKVTAKSIGKAMEKKSFGRVLMLRARGCLLRCPGGLDFDGPKWGVEPRPLELSISLEFGTPVANGVPATPPPSGPPSFEASTSMAMNAPIFDPTASWDASLAASAGCFPSPWEASADLYYEQGDVSGMCEVPIWPFDLTGQSMSPSYDSAVQDFGGFGAFGKVDGQDLEDAESTTASSGQRSLASSAVQSPANEVQARLQVEYYLSPENLCRDNFLRSHLDEEGYLSLEVVAAFPRMRQIGLDASGVAATLLGSKVVEVCWGEPPRIRLISPELRAKYPGTGAPGSAPADKEEQPWSVPEEAACLRTRLPDPSGASIAGTAC